MKIYNREIVEIGEFLQDSYEDKFIILFDEKAPEEYREYCTLHKGDELNGIIEIGDIISLGNEEYKITAVGNVVNQNLKELGHITIKFDGAIEANQPGTLHVEDKEIKRLIVGDKIEIIK